ncbi:RNase adapter RapZ [Tateyamaria sp. ANG-S1]|uniref:RNase adapter RapZ n=1 Tax=Tateyamaria sp. ANG-S1 TaxID=1577905 RepID=UPI00057F8F4A|nr:RNase adapter RapZ [Tateyamaria sp. ANG-S1]KIC52013.1 glmZ(sRNA)-inactivating NTPase [Tateyamaria sp. ANG-S1]
MPTARRLVLVTGPSGAGRSSAIRVLEDLGYEAIDNMPMRLIRALLDDPSRETPVALGLDPRNRDFTATAINDALGQIAAVPSVMPELLYLDCQTDVLLNRFSETRRRHPLAEADRVEAGILREKDLLAPVRARADVLIDTSDLNVHQLRAEVEHWFSPGEQSQLAVSVQSFSYKRGLPRSVDMVFDCRFLKNPYWKPALRQKTGLDADVKEHIASDPRAREFETRLRDLLLWQLPAVLDEGKSHLSVAFGCTGGQHRSVAMAETVAAALAEAGWQVSIRHRELDRRKREEASA